MEIGKRMAGTIRIESRVRGYNFKCLYKKSKECLPQKADIFAIKPLSHG
jgi:hypothetical protein